MHVSHVPMCRVCPALSAVSDVRFLLLPVPTGTPVLLESARALGNGLIRTHQIGAGALHAPVHALMLLASYVCVFYSATASVCSSYPFGSAYLIQSELNLLFVRLDVGTTTLIHVTGAGKCAGEILHK